VPDEKYAESTRITKALWSAILKAENLGMNRGTTIPGEDLVEKKAEKERYRIKNKGGRPVKKGPKSTHLKFNKKDRVNAIRYTHRLNETSGVFQLGGIRHYGSSEPIGAGRGKKGGERGPDDSGAFIRYIGGENNLVRLEKAIAAQESGRVAPSGYGADY